MAEVRLEIDLAHPPERVWRALTDAQLLGEWFMPTNLEPREGGQFTLEPGELAGFVGPVSGELTELAPPRRIAMLWQGERLHTRVVWEVTETASGSQVRVVQSGFIGAPATLRRRALRATYGRLFGEQLPDVLDRLAAGQGGFAPAAWDDQTASSPRAAVPRQRRAPAELTARAAPGRTQPAAEPTGPAADATGPAADPWPGGPTSSGGVVMPAARVPLPRAATEQTGDQPGPEPAGSADQAEAGGGDERRQAEAGGGDERRRAAGVALGLRPGRRGRRIWQGWRGWQGGDSGRGWRGWLAAVPAWGRAVAIGGATAVLAAAVLAGISQTWTPQLGPDRQQAPDRGRDGPGLAAQPGAGTSRATDADGRGESADGAPSPAEDGQPGAGATGEAGSAPTGPGASPPSGGDGIGPPEASPAPGQPVPAPELAAELTTSGLSLLGLNLLSLTVTVTVSNPGSAPAATWEVVVDVQGQSVGDVSGAEYQADGVYAVFTPPAGHELPAGEVDELSFTIGGLAPSAPSAADCTIDGRPCD